MREKEEGEEGEEGEGKERIGRRGDHRHTHIVR